MKLPVDGVITNSEDIVIRMRPFPNGRTNPIDLGRGWHMRKLTKEQIGTVQIGWYTVDGGETFSP